MKRVLQISLKEGKLLHNPKNQESLNSGKIDGNNLLKNETFTEHYIFNF